MKCSRNVRLSRREVLTGSVAVGGLAMLGGLGMPMLSMARQSGAAAGSNAALYAKLDELLRGDLILPGAATYDDARKLWNGMIDKHPAAVARCTGTADVMDVVRFARDNGIPATVRGGGHNVAGKALRDGAITIDLGPMRNVRVDPHNKRARAGGGARWAGFDRETLAQNLVTTGGVVSSTGVAGLTLGGGIGWLARQHGLSCDNLVAADVVTADGKLLTVDSSRNADLFWAIRGGGGNFGVVTSFEFQLHDLQPTTGGIAMYSRENLSDMLAFYRDFTASAPESVTTIAGIFAGPPDTPLEGRSAGFIAVCHSGPAPEGERLLKPIKTFGPPVIDTIGPTPYANMQTMFDPASAPGARNYWRSNFMKEIGDDAIRNIVDRADEIPPPGTSIMLEHLGGAVSRVGEQETAFANRGANFNVSVLGSWLDPAADEQNIAWTRNFGDELKAYSTGGAYVNYMARDASADNVRAAYEANFERLVAVKRKYDPDNFFSSNQNIAP